MRKLLIERNSGQESGYQPRYRYQPIVDQKGVDRLGALEPGKIFMSDPARFNDPLDMNLPVKDLTHRSPFHRINVLREAVGLLLEKNKDHGDFWLYDARMLACLRAWVNGSCHHQSLITDAARRFAEFGVACFADTLDNPLMWAHYAGQHSGFCIEYAVDEIELSNDPGNSAFYSLHVQYVTEAPEVCLSEVLFSPHQVMGRMFATKVIDWAYEREWRLVNFEKKGLQVDMPKHMHVTALIAGLNVSVEDMVKLKDAAVRLGVHALKMERKTTGEMRAEPLA